MTTIAASARKKQFDTDGYLVVRGLFDSNEVEEIRNIFARIHQEGVPGFYEPNQAGEAGTNPSDPLNQYPRVMFPHRFNERARHYLLHPRVAEILAVLFGEAPLGAQTMFYFKPPGSRGQALHQDNFYLLVEPGTCIAAWTAIDDCDAENGAMYVVPKTHRTDISCPEEADTKESFTKHYVPVPKGHRAELIPMKAGDTLFFNGSCIHGSGPNRSKDRFRRSFISHYVTQSTEKMGRFYKPLLDMEGHEVLVEANANGGPCGTPWMEVVH